MKPVHVIFIILLSFPFFGHSQGEFNNWYFGWKAGITFNYGAPVSLPGNPNISQWMLNATVSDSTGSLLFFSDGRKVYNKNKGLMPNGTGLFGGQHNCDVISVPFVSDPYKYYIFTVGMQDPDTNNPIVGLHYSVVNMQLNGGLGDIDASSKNIPLPMGDSAITQLTAIRHHNNKYAWVVVLRHGQVEEYLAYLVDPSGVSHNPVVSQSTLHNPIRGPGIHYHPSDHIRISPDGKFLVCHDSLNELCHFNSSTGIVTPMFTFRGGDTVNSGGFEFSIESRYLYTSLSPPDASGNYGRLFQYDMNNQDSLSFVNSGVHVGDSSGYRIQMGPDGKIYLDHWAGKKYLNVINNPSSPGLSCNYVQNAVYLEGSQFVWNYQSLCQFLQRYKAYVTRTGHCVGDSIHFTSDIWPPADSIHWDFGDPASGVSNFSDLPNPVHLFSGPGTYTVELWVRHIDKRTDTTWVTIVFPNPQLGPDRTICDGDSITFDAGYCEGCTYQWRNLLTGNPLGTSQTYTANATGVYEVAVTDINDCVERDTVQLTLTPRPIITNNPLSKTICSGESTNIVLTSSVANTMFNWTATIISGTVTGASADSGLIIDQVLMNPGPDPGVVRYHITPYAGSCIGDTANYLVTVNPSFPVDVSITGSANSVCQGTSVTFTATPVNQGSSPFYQWKVNGTNTGTDNPVFTYTPINGDQVYCVLTSSIPICALNNPAISDTIFMIVNPNLPVSVSVSASQNPVCAGTSVTFTATPTNGGTSPSYQWKVNGVNVGTNSSIYTYVPVNNDVITCVLNSNVFCPTGNPATSNTITMSVNPLQTVSVAIAASANPVCAGTTVIFTATPTNGGTSPSYQWIVNGVNTGTDNPVYSYSPANGDSVRCILTSSESCTSGNPVSSSQYLMTVNPILPVGISITASQNPVCAGTSVTFTATPTNGGASPQFQWKVNGINAGMNSPTYSYTPANGDQVTCVLTSAVPCPTGNPATSNTVTMIINNNLPAGVTIVANPNPFCPGTTVTYTATPINGGTSPAYQWKVNGVNAGGNSPVFSFSPQPGDSIRCVMTSNLSCVSSNPASSNKIIMVSNPVPVVTFTRCFDSVTTLNAKPIKLKGGIPLGGTYSGPGVNSVSGIFTPSIAGTGSKSLTYSYTNFLFCSASKTMTIIVQSVPSFTCGNNLTDIRDGKVYPTVQIGSQCWMAADLNYGKEISASLHQRDNCIPEKYFNPGSSIQYPASVYQWDELMQYQETPGSQGLCPPAWHVPTEAEWNTLFSNWTNNAFAGMALKYSGYSGFNALLSGVRHMTVEWNWQDVATFYWTSTPHTATKAWSHGMNDYDPGVSAYPALRSNAFSIRCLRD